MSKPVFGQKPEEEVRGKRRTKPGSRARRHIKAPKNLSVRNAFGNPAMIALNQAESDRQRDSALDKLERSGTLGLVLKNAEEHRALFKPAMNQRCPWHPDAMAWRKLNNEVVCAECYKVEDESEDKR